MATQVQRRRGTTAQHAAFTGALAETTIDTTKNTVVVHDGATAGGIPLATEASVTAHLTDAADAHDASAISIVDTGTYFTGTDVEAALQELGAVAGTSDAYAATLTVGTNVSAVANGALYYTKVGSIVTFSGYLEGVNVTAANTLSTVYATIPVASNFGSVDNAAGTTIGIDSASYTAIGLVLADTVNDRLQINFVPNGTGVIELRISGHYVVI